MLKFLKQQVLIIPINFYSYLLQFETAYGFLFIAVMNISFFTIFSMFHFAKNIYIYNTKKQQSNKQLRIKRFNSWYQLLAMSLLELQQEASLAHHDCFFLRLRLLIPECLQRQRRGIVVVSPSHLVRHVLLIKDNHVYFVIGFVE